MRNYQFCERFDFGYNGKHYNYLNFYISIRNQTKKVINLDWHSKLSATKRYLGKISDVESMKWINSNKF